ncbi:S-adenosyl-L-methionine-dependent methyltransferase, partial [Schizophyllum amplum]
AFAIIRAANLDVSSTEVLDYACGTGARCIPEIASLVKSIVGADISEGMLSEFDKNKAENMSFKLIDASTPLESQMNDRTFDLIICCMAYHHFDSPKEMTISLAKLLKPGGKLVVLDFQSGGHEAFAHHHTEQHGHAHSAHQHGHHHHDRHHSQQHVPVQPTIDPEVIEQARKSIVHKHGFGNSEMEEFMEIAGLRTFTFDTFPRIHVFNTDSVVFAATATAP